MMMPLWMTIVNGSDYLSYEELLIQADNDDLDVREKPLQEDNGRIKGKRIAIRKDIPTTTEKACVLAEEIGHYHTGSGNIIDQTNVVNRKLEMKGRVWRYNKMIGLYGLISAAKAGRHNAYDIADYLGVTEAYLLEALAAYKGKYGLGRYVNNYWIMFEPALHVYELYELE